MLSIITYAISLSNRDHNFVENTGKIEAIYY